MRVTVNASPQRRKFPNALGDTARVMSEENVKVVLEAFRCFEADDFEGLVSVYHPDSRITAPEGWPEQGPFEGRDAVIGQFRRLKADWGAQGYSDLDVAVDREGWVVFTFRLDARGAESGIATSSNMAVACRVRDAQITEGHYLETAGLSE
jgi:ketosteroid isomerase-like protein